MKNFLIKILLFLVIIVFFCQLKSIIKPYYFENDEFKIKILDFEQKQKNTNYNVFFFGSSHIYRQIIPKHFDKAALKDNLKLSSFNFGLPGCFAVEQLFLADNFSKKINNGDKKYIFMELQLPKKTHSSNAETLRGNYYFNLDAFFLKHKFEWNCSITDYFIWLKAMFYNYLNVSSLFYNKEVQKKSNILYSLNENGFLSLNKQEKLKQEKRMKHRKKTFRKNKEAVLSKIKKNVRRKLSSKDKMYINHLATLEKKYENTELILVAHPGKYVFQSKNVNGIDVLSIPYKEWKNIINSNYFYDKGHLNGKGALLYTELIYKEFAKTLTKK